MTSLKLFASAAGVRIPRTADLFDTLWEYIKHVFPSFTDQQVLDRIHVRLADAEDYTDDTSALLEFKEAQEVPQPCCTTLWFLFILCNYLK